MCNKEWECTYFYSFRMSPCILILYLTLCSFLLYMTCLFFYYLRITNTLQPGKYNKVLLVFINFYGKISLVCDIWLHFEDAYNHLLCLSVFGIQLFDDL